MRTLSFRARSCCEEDVSREASTLPASWEGREGKEGGVREVRGGGEAYHTTTVSTLIQCTNNKSVKKQRTEWHPYISTVLFTDLHSVHQTLDFFRLEQSSSEVPPGQSSQKHIRILQWKMTYR